VADFVHRPRKEEQPLIDEAIAKSLDVLPLMVEGQTAEAMTRLHTSAK
jgi:PTH1 family peptidyl-tRNA hydrolase